MKIKLKAAPRAMWIGVLLAMLAIILLWILWFYPRSLQKMDNKNIAGYLGFKNSLREALSIFKKPDPTPAPDANPDIDELRARVFGDQTQTVQ